MTKRKYKRLIKKLESIYEQIRNNNHYLKQQKYIDMKIELYKVIKTLKDNEYWWCK